MTLDRSLTFAIGTTVFRCEVTADGQRFEWRSDDGQLVAGRNVGKGTHWARARGTVIGRNFATLRAAMLAAASYRSLTEAA
jgi:hypothetical protein